MVSSLRSVGLVLGCGLLFLTATPDTQGYIDTPPQTFGSLCKVSHGVVVFTISKTDVQRRGVVLKKDRDLKGQFPAEQTGLILGSEEDKPSAKLVGSLEKSAEVTAFYLTGADKVRCAMYFYFADSWYYSEVKRGDSGSWAGSAAPVPALLGAYAGKPDELAGAAKKVLAGEEVILPCRVGTAKELASGGGKAVRLKVSLKLLTRDVMRDTVDEKR